MPHSSNSMFNKLMDETNVFSRKDIIDHLRQYRHETSEEAFEPILYFVSDFLGISIDALMGVIDDA